MKDFPSAVSRETGLLLYMLARSCKARARENLAAGDPADLVDIREGDALQTLAADLPPDTDLLLLDGATCRCPSRQTSSCRCGWVEAGPGGLNRG
jgi:hypothetical protein